MVLVLIMFGIIFKALGVYTAVAFFVGAIVSMVCGYIGMIFTIRAKITTAALSYYFFHSSRAAERSGIAMGLFPVSLGLLGKYFLMQF